jgi:hypothetical protein
MAAKPKGPEFETCLVSQTDATSKFFALLVNTSRVHFRRRWPILWGFRSIEENGCRWQEQRNGLPGCPAAASLSLSPRWPALLVNQGFRRSQAEPGSNFRLEENVMVKRRMSTFERLESGR